MRFLWSLKYLLTRTLAKMLHLIKSLNSAMLGPGRAAPPRAVGWMRATGSRISRYVYYRDLTQSTLSYSSAVLYLRKTYSLPHNNVVRAVSMLCT
jgi:hypothetical protein